MMKAISVSLSDETPSLYTQMHGVLVQGTPGSGKTSVLQAIVKQTPHSVYLSANEFYLTDPTTFIQSKEYQPFYELMVRKIQLICFDDITESSFSEEFVLRFILMNSFIKLLLDCFAKSMIVVMAVPSTERLPSFLLQESIREWM